MQLPTFITGNAFKLGLFRRYCGVDIPHLDIDLTEIQSLDPREIVTYKAQEAYQIVGTPVLVEDVSLRLDGMGMLPGPFIKFFLKELSLEKICRLVDGTERKAVAEVLYGLYDGKELHFFHNEVRGAIAEHPRGDDHGFQPIFIAEGELKTWAELTPDEWERTSLRKPALLQLQKFLASA